MRMTVRAANADGRPFDGFRKARGNFRLGQSGDHDYGATGMRNEFQRNAAKYQTGQLPAAAPSDNDHVNGFTLTLKNNCFGWAIP